MAERDNVVDLLPWDIAVRTAVERRSPRALLGREDADAVIAELSELEAYWAVKALGADDAGPLLAVLGTEQIRALFDLDVWHGGELELDDVLVWLAAFRELGAGRLVDAVRAMDPELFALLLRRRLLVARKVRDDTGDALPDWVREPPDEILPLMETPDGRFVVAARPVDERAELEDGEGAEGVEEEARKAVIELVAELYKHDDLEHAAGLLRLAETDLSSDLEETARRFREARLEDLGFPGRDRALEVYAVGDADRLVDGEPPRLAEADGVRLPAIMAAGAAQGLFAAAMRAVESPEAVHRIEGELVTLANAVLVADGVEPGELDRIAEVLTRVRATLELALAHRVDDAEPLLVARDRLVRWPLRALFSAGYGLTVRAATRARALARSGALTVAGRALGLVDDADRAVLLALTRGPRPLFAEAKSPLPRPFGAPEELAAVDRVLGELEVWAAVAERLDLAAASAALGGDVEPPEALERTLSVLVGTLAARAILDGAAALVPVGAEALARLGAALAELGADGAGARAAPLIAAAGGRPPDDRAVGARVARAVAELAEALVPLVKAGRPIDPRFVGGLIRGRR